MKKFIIILFLMASTANAQDTNPLQGTPGTPLQVQTGSRPVPDPTVLTAEAIRELRVELTKWIELRFDDFQRQIDRNQVRLDQVPVVFEEALVKAEKLTTEKFKGLADQQVQRDNNLALALTAAQKSVSDTNLSTAEAARKAENTFKDQIEATQKIIDGLNDRVTRIESSSSGAGGAVNWVIAAISIFIAIVGGVIGLVSFLRTPVPLPVVPVTETQSEPRRKPR